jgi:hypothetical protein
MASPGEKSVGGSKLDGKLRTARPKVNENSEKNGKIGGAAGAGGRNSARYAGKSL